MERRFRKGHFNKVLEVGAGEGEHLRFVRHTYDEYWVTDIRLTERSTNFDTKIKWKLEDAEKLSFVSGSFNRVICTCLLHHVNEPERVLQELRRVTKRNGNITIFLSCDPGILVRLIRSLTIKRRAKRKGFAEFDLYTARDHKNHVHALLKLVKHVFKHDRLEIRFYPFLVPIWNANGFAIIQVVKS